MHYVIPKWRNVLKRFSLITLLLISACGTTGPRTAVGTQEGYARLASVTLEPGMSQRELETLYGGEAILFDPAAGFAVLGFSEYQAGLTTLATEHNQATFTSPELAAQGASARSGGASAWAGGASAWAGGASAWAGGARTGTPLDNVTAWEQIGLYDAHTDLAPHLGQDVIVAVIDTGVDLRHPVFEGRLVDGWDFIGNDALAQEEGTGANYGHGTAVAGVILQVAPLAKIMPLRILDANGVGDTDDLVLALDWAIENGADIINLSLGAKEASEAVEKVLEKAKEREIAIIASAGNDGDERVTFPASQATKGGKFKNALVSVGSVNKHDEKSAFSSYGKDKVETAAPGENIFTVYPNDQVTYWSGTSFAAPMVSGAIALALGEPTLRKKVKDLPKAVTEKVMNKLYDIDANRGNVKDGLGKGRLDLPTFLDDVLKN